MITKGNYLKALNVVEEYHRQINVEIVKHKPKTKTLIKDWRMLKYASTRLYNVLKEVFYDDFVEELTSEKMRDSRRCGEKTIKEFKELRGY